MDKRSFPRYNILSLNTFITIGEDKIWVKDISLGGLQLFHTQKLIVEQNKEAIFYFGQKSIQHLTIKEVWTRESISKSDMPLKMPERLTEKLKSITHLYGIELFFEEYGDFKNWRTLIQAMHKHQFKT